MDPFFSIGGGKALGAIGGTATRGSEGIRGSSVSLISPMDPAELYFWLLNLVAGGSSLPSALGGFDLGYWDTGCGVSTSEDT